MKYKVYQDLEEVRHVRYYFYVSEEDALEFIEEDGLDSSAMTQEEKIKALAESYKPCHIFDFDCAEDETCSLDRATRHIQIELVEDK